MTTLNFAKLTRNATKILRENDRGGYTIPTPGLYPFQWNWDSCLNALGWAKLDEARAWQEIEMLFAAQWSDGMVPHIVFHEPSTSYFPGPDTWRTGRIPNTSGITQPPVAATAIRMLFEGATDKQLAQQTVKRLLPRVYAWHRWFRSARDPNNTGLIAMLHPWETGWDNSPAWDDALAAVPTDGLEPYERKDVSHINSDFRPTEADYRGYVSLVQRFRDNQYDPEVLFHVSPFRMADLCTNSVLLRAEQDLQWLAETNGEPAIALQSRASFQHGAGAFQNLWDQADNVYRSKDLITNRLVDERSSATFLAFYAGVVPEDKVAGLIKSYDEWVDTVNFAVPTYPAGTEKFDSQRYWRGPTWPIVNFLIADGLSLYGFGDRAKRIQQDTAQLIAESGFFEYFDTVGGRGLGADNFSWTAAMWLAWLEPSLTLKT